MNIISNIFKIDDKTIDKILNNPIQCNISDIMFRYKQYTIIKCISSEKFYINIKIIEKNNIIFNLFYGKYGDHLIKHNIETYKSIRPELNIFQYNNKVFYMFVKYYYIHNINTDICKYKTYNNFIFKIKSNLNNIIYYRYKYKYKYIYIICVIVKNKYFDYNRNLNFKIKSDLYL